jgi:hypothetical protein
LTTTALAKRRQTKLLHSGSYCKSAKNDIAFSNESFTHGLKQHSTAQHSTEIECLPSFEFSFDEFK